MHLFSFFPALKSKWIVDWKVNFKANKVHRRKDKSDVKRMEILEFLELSFTIGSEPPGNHGNIGNGTNCMA